MCGIGGIFGRAPVAREAMIAALRHRGPDAEGASALVSAAGASGGTFVHCRLAILDLSSASNQPIVSADGRYSMVFNGEIYNFRALREELIRDGASLRTQGDTEVLLEGWARHGHSWLARLRGMFALAIWDARLAKGYLARDAFGIKPMFVARVAEGVVFASELRAVLASGLVPRRLSREGVASYLATGSVTEPLSIVEGVEQLPAGTIAEVVGLHGRLVLGAPTTFDDPILSPARELERDPERAAALVRDALRESVRHHLVSDVPVGLFLSGGIDSSIVVALASEQVSQPLETFTIVFGERAFSEEGPAATVAARFRTRHQAIPLSGDDFLQALPAAFASMDQPSLDGLNTYVVSRAVRERGLKVVLSGLGGDEMFAGYPSFERAATMAGSWRGLAPARRVASGMLARASGVRAEKLALMLSQPTAARAAYVASRALFGPRQVTALAGRNAPRVLVEPPAGLTTLQQVSWYELTGYMRNTLLRDSDVFSMAHGLELRVPFVDRGVAQAAASVCDSLKLRRGVSKPLLLSSVRDLLPRDVWDRPKQGFLMPFDPWLRGPLRAAVDAEFTAAGATRAGLEPQAVREVWQRFDRGGVTWSRPWALYTLVRWARENGVAIDGAHPPALVADARMAVAG